MNVLGLAPGASGTVASLCREGAVTVVPLGPTGGGRPAEAVTGMALWSMAAYVARTNGPAEAVVVCTPASRDAERSAALVRAARAAGLDPPGGIVLVPTLVAIRETVRRSGLVPDAAGGDLVVCDVGERGIETGRVRSPGVTPAAGGPGALQLDGNGDGRFVADLLGEPVGVGGIGGESLDAALAAQVLADRGLPTSEADPGLVLECRRARSDLERAMTTSIDVPGPDGPERVTLDRDDLARVTGPLIRWVTDTVRREVAAGPVAAVVLAGGAAGTPGLRDALEGLGTPVVVPPTPRNAAAQGAAWLAESFAASATASATVPGVAVPVVPVAGAAPVDAPATGTAATEAAMTGEPVTEAAATGTAATEAAMTEEPVTGAAATGTAATEAAMTVDAVTGGPAIADAVPANDDLDGEGDGTGEIEVVTSATTVPVTPNQTRPETPVAPVAAPGQSIFSSAPAITLTKAPLRVPEGGPVARPPASPDDGEDESTAIIPVVVIGPDGRIRSPAPARKGRGRTYAAVGAAGLMTVTVLSVAIAGAVTTDQWQSACEGAETPPWVCLLNANRTGQDLVVDVTSAIAEGDEASMEVFGSGAGHEEGEVLVVSVTGTTQSFTFDLDEPAVARAVGTAANVCVRLVDAGNGSPGPADCGPVRSGPPAQARPTLPAPTTRPTRTTTTTSAPTATQPVVPVEQPAQVQPQPQAPPTAAPPPRRATAPTRTLAPTTAPRPRTTSPQPPSTPTAPPPAETPTASSSAPEPPETTTAPASTADPTSDPTTVATTTTTPEPPPAP